VSPVCAHPRHDHATATGSSSKPRCSTAPSTGRASAPGSSSRPLCSNWRGGDVRHPGLCFPPPQPGATAPALAFAQSRTHGAPSSGATSLGEPAGASVCRRAVGRGGAGVRRARLPQVLAVWRSCHGFGRARCPRCGHDCIIAFSGRARAVCPSCHSRRLRDPLIV